MFRIESHAPNGLDEFKYFVAAQAAVMGPLGSPIDYMDLSPQVKDQLRTHLLESQRYRCAYCERPLVDDRNKCKIEHFHPRKLSGLASYSSTCRARTDVSQNDWHKINVALSNLLVCCTGNTGVGAPKTCDTRKADAHICHDFYNPKVSSFPSLINVNPQGEATVIAFPNTQSRAQHVLDNVLGLNETLLKNHRKDFYEALEGEFSELYKSKKLSAPHVPGAKARIRRELADDLRNGASVSRLPSVQISFANSV